MFRPFDFYRTPSISFGAGMLNNLGNIAASRSRQALLITGESSLHASCLYERIAESLEEAGVKFTQVSVSGEPSPHLVDEIVRKTFLGDPERSQRGNPGVIISVGGGSVIDSGKAIAAMACKPGETVQEYLDGVGSKPPDGEKIPFIAVPTTAGTGSEATKNAVLSKVGEGGFKKSLRHNNFVPDVALVDPELSKNCPPELTRTCGMDAFSQLLESYVSTGATPFTDSLGLDALQKAIIYLPRAYNYGAGDTKAREGMAYAALISGITLANAGLGVIHGLASELGAIINIPHGIACGALMAPAHRVTIDRLVETAPEKEESQRALEKYARVGRLYKFAQENSFSLPESDVESAEIIDDAYRVVEMLEKWCVEMSVPGLGDYGFTESHWQKLLAKDPNKNNPVKLNTEDIDFILEAAYIG